MLTIVAYHYVRDVATSAFPRLAALDSARFERQLDHIAAHHIVVGIADVLKAVEEGVPLPEGACLLTFDDGYRDHALTAAPALARRGWSGLFFPSAAAVEERRLLEVNRIQFVVAACPDRGALRRELNTLIAGHGDADTPSVATLEERWLKPGRWDDADTVFVKRVLQQGLAPALRDRLSAMLFAEHVSGDEGDFADGLYLDGADMAAMTDAGMAFGSHGTRHERLTLLDDGALAEDLDGSIAFLARHGIDVRSGFTLCYPHGAHDARVRAAARARGCRLAVTVEPRVAIPGRDDPLALPRLDTNDLPS